RRSFSPDIRATWLADVVVRLRDAEQLSSRVGEIRMPEGKHKNVLASDQGVEFVESFDRLLTAQSKMLADIDALTRAWLDRRREGIDAVCQAVQDMGRCQYPADMLRIQQDWFSGARRRVTEDIVGLSDGIALVTRTITAPLEALAPIAREP